MWLFDNLFLDQNTPITINDGVDHSQDVVTVMVDPTEQAWLGGDPSGAQGGWNPKDDTKKDDTKKDDSIADLFESDKKEENDAHATLHPEPPKDIALEIGMAPADPSLAVSDFDIGGDISFDSIPETNIVIDGATPATSDLATPPLTDLTAQESPALWVSITPDITGWLEPPPTEISGTFLGAAPAPSTDTPTPIDVTPDVWTPTVSEPLPNVPVSGGEGSILDLIGGSSDATPVAPPVVAPVIDSTPIIDTTGSEAKSTVPTDMGNGNPLTASLDQGSATSPLSALGASLWSFGSMSPEMLLGREALALVNQSGQWSGFLREKLYSFIEELKALHSRDQSQRYHKLEQIAMYEERIREIDAEAANRKRVLQAEIDDLKRQIEMMDREKNDIQGVISAFHKEIGNS
jgi:hypothetical protein